MYFKINIILRRHRKSPAFSFISRKPKVIVAAPGTFLCLGNGALMCKNVLNIFYYGQGCMPSSAGQVSLSSPNQVYATIPFHSPLLGGFFQGSLGPNRAREVRSADSCGHHASAFLPANPGCTEESGLFILETHTQSLNWSAQLWDWKKALHCFIFLKF